jgi:ribosomal protein S18 acetylase RimI-like enzyme
MQREKQDAMEVEIRQMQEADIPVVAQLHAECFSRQKFSLEWISCNFRAFPRMRYFVAEHSGKLLGFIHWTEKSGLREEVVLDLEQLGVKPEVQGQGIGSQLIKKSLPLVAQALKQRGAVIKHILVNTRTDNHAQKLYANTLGAQPEAVIKALFSGDELYMIARNIKIEPSN